MGNLKVSAQRYREIERLAWSVPEAAIRTGLSVRKLWTDIKQGLLHPQRIGGRTLVSEEELRRYLGLSSGRPTAESRH
jgi:hypothetical protein